MIRAYALRGLLVLSLLAMLGSNLNLIAQTSCDSYACNCVKWVRCARVPSLPYGLDTLADKKKIINSYTPAVGSVAVMDIYGDVGHLAYVAAVFTDSSGNVMIRVEEANYDACQITYNRTGTPGAMKVVGYYNPGGSIAGRPDLVAIKKSGTANGKAEVHISSGASNFQQYLLNTATVQTVESPDSYDFELADW